MEKYYTYIRWALLGMLSAAFLYEGVDKLLGRESQQFTDWGFPIYVVYIVGAAQLFGALGMLYTKTVKLALTTLTIVMICAILTLAGKHLFYPSLVLPIIYLISLFGLMYLKAKRTDDSGRWGLI